MYRNTILKGAAGALAAAALLLLAACSLGGDLEAWRIKAREKNGDNSNPSGLSAPANLRVTATTANSVSLEWDALSGAIGYRVYCYPAGSSGGYEPIGGDSGTSYTHTGLQLDMTYSYKVAGYNDGGTGPQSGAVSATTADPVTVPGSGLAAKLNWLQSNAASNRQYIVEVSADESIVPQTLSYSGKNNITITLQGDYTTRTISLSAIGSMFTVESGVTLILDNYLTLQGRSNNNAALIEVNSGGTLFMNTGSKIIGNTNSASHGGGILVIGTFTMDGGEISGNTNSTSSDGSASRGGGVFVIGTFTMNGGEISGNINSSFTSSYSSQSYGGGVGVYVGGTFTMNGGEISGNTNSSFTSSYPSQSYGGGVHVDGTFTMNGGEISGNTNSSSSSSYYARSHGGGVYVGGTFTMNSGEISGNTNSSSSDTSPSYTSSSGGGVYVNGGTFTMGDGEISGNTASNDGGGVYVFDGAFTMSGGEISGNAASNGGGVFVGYYIYFSPIYGTFQMAGGVIYGSGASTTLKNTATTGASLYKASDAIAQYGVLSGGTFYRSGDLSDSDDTLRVVSGGLQNY
ncbi:hypothetical protein AGMMS49928_13900 [Spirochaetia bacterium]|nr:hypothetical protein AGMMS49928_13900 [Spirochaetia bacterium]